MNWTSKIWWAIEVSKGLTPLAVACFALMIGLLQVGIGRRSAVTAERKLRLDLYNRRFDVYLSVKRYVSQLARYETTTDEARLEISFRCSEAMFLFDKRVIGIVSDILAIGMEVEAADRSIASLNEIADRQNRDELIEKRSAACKRAIERTSDCTTSMMPYLDFRTVAASI